MPVDTDTVESVIHDIAEQGLRLIGGDGGIGQQDGQHGGHVGADHAAAFGESGDLGVSTIVR